MPSRAVGSLCRHRGEVRGTEQAGSGAQKQIRQGTRSQKADEGRWHGAGTRGSHTPSSSPKGNAKSGPWSRNNPGLWGRGVVQETMELSNWKGRACLATRSLKGLTYPVYKQRPQSVV